jgi:hypothetical protein
MADLKSVKGKITYLRVHELGGGFGPATDFLEAEAIIRLSVDPQKAFGIPLRPDNKLASHTAMLGLLQEAFKNNWEVTVEYLIDPGKQNGLIQRVIVTK